MDQKQKRLIAGWIEKSTRETDPYFAYMSAWIGFNAYCCAMYASEANRPRADIGKSADLEGLGHPSTSVPVSGSLARTANRVRIDLTDPFALRIDIRHRYTEDRIFSAFSADSRNQQQHAELTRAGGFTAAATELADALSKPGHGPVVINMAKAAEYSSDAALEQLLARNIVQQFDPTRLSSVVNTLYQIRCNIFHGEKLPGELNDNRVVKAALPVLRHLLERFIQQSATG